MDVVHSSPLHDWTVQAMKTTDATALSATHSDVRLLENFGLRLPGIMRGAVTVSSED
jgi:hypothetical protein